MDMRVETAPSARLAMMTMIGSYEQFHEYWPKFMDWAGQAGLFQPGAQVGTIYRNSPMCTPEDELHSDLYITVSDDFEAPADITIGDFPPGKYAVVSYVGPYEGLAEAWPAAHGQVSGSHTGREGSSFDIYVRGPGEEDLDPNEYVTEFWIPIE